MDDRWANLMEANITEVKTKVESMDEKLDKIDKSLAVHKVKSGFWGAIGGILIQIVNIFR
jgi:hypothetical protein